MKYASRQNKERQVPRRRRLKTKPLLILIIILFLSNIFWFIMWLAPSKSKQIQENVASVNGTIITREHWMGTMEEKIGRETLQELINIEVMKAIAKAYGIKISEKEIDLELALIRSIEQGEYVGLNEENERNAIQSKLILEKVLTKDIVINDEDIQNHYNEHIDRYQIDDAYRTSIIVLPTLNEAERVIKELNEGSSFEVLAKEVSIDVASSNLGGDIGYINESVEFVDKKVVDVALTLKSNAISSPIALEDGTYAIITVKDHLKGKNFKLNEVKDHIKRELAMRQLPEKVTPEDFWKDFQVEWFYGKK